DLDQRVGRDEVESGILRVRAVEIHVARHCHAPFVVGGLGAVASAGRSKFRRAAPSGRGPRIFAMSRPRWAGPIIDNRPLRSFAGRPKSLMVVQIKALNGSPFSGRSSVRVTTSSTMPGNSRPV